MGLEALAAYSIHSLTVYGGAKAVGLRRTGVIKAMVAAFLSYLAVLILAPILIPLKLIPLVGSLFGAIVLAVGTAVAAKVVLNCEWKQAQVIGLISAAVNLLFAFSIGRWI